MITLGLAHLRTYAVARSLFGPTSLPKAIARLGFVQADPIRAPARAQDLILRHRVKGYQAGDLERRYSALDVEEDFFVNYGYMPRSVHQLMHPRAPRTAWNVEQRTRAQRVLEFVRARGVTHPREVDQHFAHGRARNWFGGTSMVSTQLLDAMHYRGLLRIARRESGIRLYQARTPDADAPDPASALAQLVDVVVGKYAPLPAASLSHLIHRLGGGVPQWQAQLRATVAETKARLSKAHIDGVDWYWPVSENPLSKRHQPDDAVRLLAPFDPVVWDRRRFEMLWGWPYRFEAYTPAHARERGYYALPLLWRDAVIGWANVSVVDQRLQVEVGFVGTRPRGAVFRAALDQELARMQEFLRLPSTSEPTLCFA